MNSKTSTSQRNFTFDESRRQNKSPVSCRSKLQIGSFGTKNWRKKKKTKKGEKQLIYHQPMTGADNIFLTISKA